MPALERWQERWSDKAEEFDDVVKIGRTHLQDATPIRLGQEFGGYARQIAHASSAADGRSRRLLELPLGGTAVGTGINAHPEFARARGRSDLAESTGLSFVEAENHFEAQARQRRGRRGSAVRSRRSRWR